MLDDLRRFLADVPILADLIQQAVYQDRGRATNTEEQRFHLEELHAQVMASLRENRVLYGVLYNPEAENHCPICRRVVHGHYLELNNPVTGKAIISATRLLHAFVEHEQTFYRESMVNVSGTRVGEMCLVLDMKAIAGVIAGSDAPPEVLAQSEEAIAVQKRQLDEEEIPA